MSRRITNIKDNIYTYMLTITDLTNIIDSGSIGWQDIDQTDTYPKLVFTKISSPPLYQCDDQFQRWRFYAFSDSKVECENIIEILNAHFHRLTGDMGGLSVSYISRIDESEPIRRENMYEKYIDFRITYNFATN